MSELILDVDITDNSTDTDIQLTAGQIDTQIYTPGAGSNDYNDLVNKPSIEGVELIGDKTLEELGAANIPTIYVYNKSDLCGVPLRQMNDDTIFMSAKDEESLQVLLSMIRSHAHKDYVDCQMRIPFERGDVFSYLKKQAIVEETEYKADGTYIKLQCRHEDYERYKEFLI